MTWIRGGRLLCVAAAGLWLAACPSGPSGPGEGEGEGEGEDAPDGDDDGVADVDDNCPDDGNPDQEDLDGDTLGDACDDDIDGDGLLNDDDDEPRVAAGPVVTVVTSNVSMAASRQRDVRATFSCDRPTCVLTCALDDAAPASCDDGFSADDVAPGSHRLRVTGAQPGALSSTITMPFVVAESGVILGGFTTFFFGDDAPDNGVDDVRPLSAGANGAGQLGHGTTSDMPWATPISDDPADGSTTQLAPGGNGSCLVRAGELFCFGFALVSGQDPQQSPRTPLRVGDATDWRSASVGPFHACATKTDGSLWCWGDNTAGQLGTGAASGAATLAPARTNIDGHVIDVDTGTLHTCALTVGGDVWCFGTNRSGQLALEGSDDVPTPTLVHTGAVDIDASGDTTCALQEDGSLWCWGAGDSGQLGNGASTSSDTPVLVAGDVPWRSVTVGPNHVCGVDEDGTAHCWGGNDTGQLGDGTTEPRAVPTAVGAADELSAGQGHTCASTGMEVRCWGSRSNGQLADGSLSDVFTPGDMPLIEGAVSLSAGGNRTCAVETDTSLSCWGSTPLVDDSQGWGHVSVGPGHACALRGDGIFCWGYNGFGELGDGTTTTSPTPVPAMQERAWTRVAVGGNHTCAIESSGALYCWGYGVYGQLGGGVSQDSAEAVLVSPDLLWRDVALGNISTCGLTTTDELYCWGNAASGQVPTGDFGNFSTPQHVPGAWRSLTSGFNHACAIRDDGTLHCWGYNSDGNLGDGTLEERRLPVQVGTSNDWAGVAASFHAFTCAWNTGGALFCFGDNDSGQLGDATNTDRSLPTPVQTTALPAALALGADHACMRTTSDEVLCWGDNNQGQLGIVTGFRSTQAPIALSPF